MAVKDLTGLKFGKLEVLGKAGLNKYLATTWNVKCDCGTTKIIVGHSLTSGGSTACGKCRGAPVNRTHNLTKTPEFRVWSAMKNRCYNSKQKSYKYYGGRGIKVCEEWLGEKGFENFMQAMGVRPDNTSIERINVDGNYEPSNCKWIPNSEQALNKRSNHTLTSKGVTKTLSEWARDLRCDPSAILARLKSGWSEEDAVTIPPSERPNSKLNYEQAQEIRGIYPTLSSQKLADKYGVSKKTILNVLHNKVFTSEEPRFIRK